MPKQLKPASTIDRTKNHTCRKKLDKREQTEMQLQSKTRNLICPEHLSDEAKKEWARIVAIDNSRATPIICDADISMPEILCEYYSALQTAIKEKNYALMDKLAKGIKSLYAEFSLTPRGRANFGMESKGNENADDDDFF